MQSPQGATLRTRGVLQGDVMDLPASAAAKRRVGHIGYHGCLDCEIEGEMVFSAKENGKKKLAFPPRGDSPIRTSASTLTYATIARNKTGQAPKHKGVYGPTILSTILGYDETEGTLLDYMHESAGLGKDVLSLLFDSKNHKKPWYYLNYYYYFAFKFQRPFRSFEVRWCSCCCA